MGHRTAAVAHRVLIVAPFGRDAAHLEKLLAQQRYQVQIFERLSDLADAIDEHAGVLILSEESLDSTGVLEAALRRLPPWTDMPCVFLQSRQSTISTRLQRAPLPPAIINRIVLERPTSGAALIDSVAALMRARQKQFEVHDHVEALSASRRELEQKVVERTAQLESEMRSRLDAEAALRQSQKMEVLGQLTGGVAHDFNNLLTPIVGALDLLRETVRGDPRSDGIASTGLRAAERAKLLVQRLLAFARRQHLQSRAVSVPDLFESLRELWVRALGPSIATRFEAAEGLPLVQIDPVQLELALLNLALNARDAMGGNGVIRVSASARSSGATRSLAPGKYVAICVADTGCGMDEATLQKAIEPFFTTKDVGAGTGLGLSMVHGLAAQSGGELTIDSKVGKGTTVTLLLPIAVEASEPAEIPTHSVDHAHSVGYKVLLVDDEELLRTITAELLSVAGHRVTQASGGEEALELLSGGFEPDIVLTDYSMDGMNGAQLARAIKDRFEARPTLLMTGYAAVDDEEATQLPRLAKPFRASELIDAVERVMTAHRET